eukprot:COSAG01_NODE_915_length_12761_cov_33.161507_5_plen_62_part_00
MDSMCGCLPQVYKALEAMTVDDDRRPDYEEHRNRLVRAAFMKPCSQLNEISLRCCSLCLRF